MGSALWNGVSPGWLTQIGLLLLTTLGVGVFTNRAAFDDWWNARNSLGVRSQKPVGGETSPSNERSLSNPTTPQFLHREWRPERTVGVRRPIYARQPELVPVSFQNVIDDTPPPLPQPRFVLPNEQPPIGRPGFSGPSPVVGIPPQSFAPTVSDPQLLQSPAQQQSSGSGERRFSFNFQNVPWEWVLKKFSQEAGLSLQMTTPPPGTFSYFDQNRYALTEVLDILNDHLIPDGFIAAKNGRAMIVLDSKSEFPESLVPFVSSEELVKLGRNELACVAVPVHNGLAAAAAQEIEKLLSPLGKVVPLSSSQRLLVTDVGASLRRIHQLMTLGGHGEAPQCSFVYQLRNTPAEEVARAISEFLAGKRQAAAQASSATSSGAARGSTAGSFTPQGASTQITLGQVVIAEKTTNSLLVRGSVAEVAEIQKLIVQLDRLPAQVLIQALLVEVELGDTDEFGVELGVQDSVLFDRSVIDKLVTLNSTNTAPNGVQTTTQNIISQTASPGFNFNNQPLGNNTAISPNKVGTQGLTSLGVGRVNGDLGFGGLVLSAGSESISVLLRALQQRYHVDILSRPQIRALDNHEALIQIGRQVPVVDGVSVSPVGSANPVIRQDQSGIILKVVPRISPDGQVLIDVKAEKSAYQLTPGTGVPIFTDATNGNVIEAPVKDITTATTAVNVRSEQTIVLGGMITRDNINVNRKVPFLGDIPYLGEAFKYKLSESKRKELLIFLTPIIIQDDGHSEQLKLEEMQRIIMPHEDAQRIHGRIQTPPVGSFGANATLGTPFVEPGPNVNPVYTPGQLMSPNAVPQSAAPPNWSGYSSPPQPPNSGYQSQPYPPTSYPNSSPNLLPPEPQTNASPPTKKKLFSTWKPFSSQRDAQPTLHSTNADQQEPHSVSTEPTASRPTVSPASYARPRQRR